MVFTADGPDSVVLKAENRQSGDEDGPEIFAEQAGIVKEYIKGGKIAHM